MKTGTVTPAGYRCINVDGTNHFIHRLVAAAFKFETIKRKYEEYKSRGYRTRKEQKEGSRRGTRITLCKFWARGDLQVSHGHSNDDANTEHDNRAVNLRVMFPSEHKLFDMKQARKRTGSAVNLANFPYATIEYSFEDAPGEIGTHDQGVTSLAAQLGVKRTSLSQVLNGRRKSAPCARRTRAARSWAITWCPKN